MQTTVIVTIAKNGYLVKYYTPVQRSDLQSSGVVGPVESIPSMIPNFREENVVVINEQEVVDLLRQLKALYYK